MSRLVPIPTSAILDSRLSPRDVTVLAAFGSISDVIGWCPQDVGRVGEMLGITRRAAQESIRALHECGYMEVRDSSNWVRVLHGTEQPAEVLRKFRGEE